MDLMLLSNYLNTEELRDAETIMMEGKTDQLHEALMAGLKYFGVDDVPQLILSNKKDFTTPILNDVGLAKRGFHVWRMCMAHYIHYWRCGNSQFDTDGLIVIEDFLDSEIAQKIHVEVMDYPIAMNKNISNLSHTFDNHTGLSFLMKSSGLASLVRECMGFEVSEYLKDNTFVQRIENRPDDNDEQKYVHMDTFFPALKFWYFPDSVHEEQGPFVYVKKSPVLNTAKLEWYHTQSVKVCEGTYDKARGRGQPEGSFRINKLELSSLGLFAEPVPVRKNTLVIANVGGFHGRGNTTDPHTRSALHGSVRSRSPFTF